MTHEQKALNGNMRKKLTIIPLGKRVLIKLDSTKESNDLIVLPDDYDAVQSRGTVLAVGPDAFKRANPEANPLLEEPNFQVKVWDTVLITKYAGTEVKDGDDVYHLVDDDCILAILK